jgi:DNA-binding SARP family transcriptional activator
MSGLYFYLFGKFDAYFGEEILAGLDPCKVQELLCYLLINRNQPHSRESLADLLWSERSVTQQKGYLRKTLWQLQAALDSQNGRLSERFLAVEPGWIQLKLDVDTYLDVAAFEKAFLRARNIRGRELDALDASRLQAAVDLYRGDLLEGWYHDWCLFERERYRHIYLAMLDKLMAFCIANHDCETGLVYGERSLRQDAARERTHRRMMRLYYLANDRTGALRQYERCVSALKDELALEPTNRTVALYQQIRADQLTDYTSETSGSPLVPEATPASLRELQERLLRFHGVLRDAQLQLQQQIQAVEQAMRSQ